MEDELSLIANFDTLNKKYPEVLKYIEANSLAEFNNCFLNINEENLEKKFLLAFRKYCNLYEKYPPFLTELGFKVIDKITTFEDLIYVDQYTIIKDSSQANLIENFNIQNIKKLEQETQIFSYNIIFFELLANYHDSYLPDFKNGTLTYEEFTHELAKILDIMRKYNVFNDTLNYDFIRGSFRDNHKEIFMDLNAPSNLRQAFYENRITAKLLHKHKEYIPYLVDKNLEITIKDRIDCYYESNFGNQELRKEDFASYFTKRFGNLKYLELISKYGNILTNLRIYLPREDLTLEEIEKQIRISIYHKIKDNDIPYQDLANIEEFKLEYPDIFTDFSLLSNISQGEREYLELAYYSKNLTFKDIKKYPSLINLLKTKDLKFNFARKINPDYFSITSDLDILDYIDNETFLELCLEYGDYLTDNLALLIEEYILKNKYKYTKEEIIFNLKQIIARECLKGNCQYEYDTAPNFLKEQYPELFLDLNSPPLLKKVFYNVGNNNPLSFYTLSEHPEWLSYLKGKSIVTALMRGCGRGSRRKKIYQKYFQLFGENVALKLGINKPETISEMIASNQIELVKQWYDKTGRKFIPDYVVMQNINIKDADKFLIAGSSWSKLMKIKDFSGNPESRDAMLKLAYSFGVFDGDARGYKKVYELLTDLPRRMKEENLRGIINMLEFDFDTNNNLIKAIEEEKFPYERGYDFFHQMYKLENGYYILTFNPEQYPKTSKYVREILNNYSEIPIIDPNKAHYLFNEFKLEYDPEFREFFLNNLDTIIEHSEYISLISKIQHQFKSIKTVNSNRTLTLDLAISYVQNNRYENVEVGNSELAFVSGIAGYSEEDFNILQRIYNYGKQRIFSSIPRIKEQGEKYDYEFLRLDDPLTLAIGTLTDCCQALGSLAEGCMEHSMTSSDGRIFVIRDKDNNIIAQSWVWRNKDVLCFDNIEVPDKQMHYHGIPKGYEDAGIKNEFTDEILDIYKKVAHQLILEDEKKLKELLDQGKIDESQFEGLRLKKITVGLGYSNISGSIKTLTLDEEIARPLEYHEPVRLRRGLYTNDSTTQYILEQQPRVKYDGPTLAIHHDTYNEYQDTNFTVKMLYELQRLEIITKGLPSFDTNLEDNFDEKHLVSSLALNYNLNPKTTKIIYHPNFAIIYDDTIDKVIIGDLLFNTNVSNNEIDIEDKLVLQIKLALDQIRKNKKIDISKLNENQKKMYEKAINLNYELDIERGLGNVK